MNVFKNKNIVLGALTSKPYAFKARSWELVSVLGIDFFDSFGSNIRIDSRGLEILRVLPYENIHLNEEWITDKIRFGFDGLKYQRLNIPLSRRSGILVPRSWSFIIKEFQSVLMHSCGLQRTRGNIGGLLGRFVDVETGYAFRQFITRLGGTSFVSHDDGVSLNSDFRNFYLLNKKFKNLSSTDSCVFVGSNVRYESPMLYLKIRQSKCLVLNFGVGVFTMKHSFTIKNKVAEVVSLLRGKSKFSRLLLKSKNVFIFSGLSLYQRIDADNLLSYFKSIELDFIGNKFSKIFSTMLSPSISLPGTLDVGLSLRNIYNKNKPSFLYVLGGDNFSLLHKPETIIYQGFHGDRVAGLANVVLPTTAPTEQRSVFMNIFGQSLVSNFVRNPPGDSRVSWKIFKVFSDFVKSDRVFEFCTPEFFQKSLSLEGLDIKGGNVVLNQPLQVEPVTSVFRFFNTPVNIFSTNYFLTDSISRASQVLVLADKRLSSKSYNFNSIV